PLDRVVRREAGVGEGDVLDRVEVPERDEVAGVVDDHVLRHGAGCTEAGRGDAELGGSLAVVLLALGAHVAVAAAPRAVDGDGGADLEPGDALAELVDDAGALVAEGER